MKAEDLKCTKDEAIAAGFKHKIASLNKDIEEIKSCKVDLMSEYERSHGREMNAEIMLANGQILPIDDIDICDDAKKNQKNED